MSLKQSTGTPTNALFLPDGVWFGILIFLHMSNNFMGIGNSSNGPAIIAMIGT